LTIVSFTGMYIQQMEKRAKKRRERTAKK